MFFTGQEHIILQLGEILPYVHETRTGVNLLFRGPSGYGKTYLANKCCKYLVGDKFDSFLGDKFNFDENVWVHLIDEIHLMEHPEVLYPILDSGKYVFIFTTNFDSLLPEALTNRCKNFIFVDYSIEELVEIFDIHSKLKFPDMVVRYIVECAGRNPRIIVKTFADILKMHYRKQTNIPSEPSEILNEIDKLFGIEEGLDRVSRQYLETLEKLGGRSSISLLSSSMHLDKNTIQYSVEPALLYKKLIRITSRGRELI